MHGWNASCSVSEDLITPDCLVTVPVPYCLTAPSLSLVTPSLSLVAFLKCLF